MINYELVKEFFDYDIETGNLIWKRHKGGVTVGRIAGNFDDEGYARVRINGKNYKLHSLIWLWCYGEWPEKTLDHIDGNPRNNRIDNLRLATLSENQQNRKHSKNNKSGYPGVCWDKTCNKWKAYIKKDYKTINLGNFTSPEDAYAAYLKGKKKYHTFQPIPRTEENTVV